jgi:hypothetical protein
LNLSKTEVKVKQQVMMTKGMPNKTPEQRQIDHNAAYSVLLMPDTKEALHELYLDLPERDREYFILYDALIMGLIHFYRRKKGLSEYWKA